MSLTHHYVFGMLNDYITGDQIPDTHDERLRQKIARILVEEKGFDVSEIEPRKEIIARAGVKSYVVKIDYLIFQKQKACMVIKYGPGSIVTRHRPGLAAARVVEPYQIPVVVITNGIDADIIDGSTGRVRAKGIDSIPDKKELSHSFDTCGFEKISKKKQELESRVLYTFEVEDSCEMNCIL